MLSGMSLCSLDIDGTLTCYISNKRSFCSPFDHICYDKSKFSENMNLKPLLSLLFFEHRYLS